MKNIKLFTFSILFTCSVFSQNNIWTLEECVQHALENNISILQAKNSLLSSEQDIVSAKGNFLPAVSSNISGGASLGNIEVFPGEFRDREFYSTSLGVGFSQSVFNGFRNINLLNQSKLSLERNQYELEKLKDDISLNVANAYLNVLFNKENLELAKSQLKFSKFQVQQVTIMVESGSEPMSTLIETQATYSRDIQSLTIAENNQDLALLTLSQLLQLPYDDFDVEIIQIDTPSTNLMYDDIAPILNYAMENRNEIKVAERDIELARLGTKISKSAYLPNISMGYGFNASANFSNLTNDDQLLDQLNDNKGHSVNMNVSIPIFNRNQTKAQVKKSKIQEETTNLALDQIKINLESTIQRAFTDAKAALRAFEAAQLSLNSQALAFDNSKERFTLGAINSYDLEQSRIRLLNAESSSINAKYDFIFKTKVLDYYLGKR
jgi:outer membrane protein|tara:strand:- start:142 stop:1452 length:1311 start_codon:yes stop_codon:yes gene_type:complete